MVSESTLGVALDKAHKLPASPCVPSILCDMSCPFAAVFQFHPSGLWEVVNGQRLGAENYGHSLALDVLQEELVGFSLAMVTLGRCPS